MDDHANRVLAYMAQNAEEGIKYKTQGGEAAYRLLRQRLDVTVAHSTTGFCSMYGGAAISYGSKLQRCISLSSTEAEIVAVAHTAAEVINLRGLLAEMGREETQATP
eukprot:6209221-Pleurochrysis_carterae.AAC.1